MNHKKQKFFSRQSSGFILLTFLTGQILTPSIVSAQALPASGTMLGLSAAYAPPVLLGLKVHPENPLLFDFIVDRGQSNLSDEEFKVETEKLVKYFFAALTIPDKEVWVNLSPYEKDRIIPDVLGRTQMGKTMLEQDYMLKQLAASLTNPETKLGKTYWDQINSVIASSEGAWQSQNKIASSQNTAPRPERTSFGRNDNSNMFSKVWIVPAKAKVLESNGIVVVDEKRLKVMMAEDVEENIVIARSPQGDAVISESRIASLDRFARNDFARNNKANLSTNIFRETILPSIEKEVNEGKDFAAVRQVYNSVILAAWYKQALKESLLGRVYADQAKVAGVEIDDIDMKERVYAQYVQAFKKGVYNFIKEEKDASGDLIPRKYFSGGIEVAKFGQVAGSALEIQVVSSAAVEQPILRASAAIVTVQGEESASAAAIEGNLPAKNLLNEVESEFSASSGVRVLIPTAEQMPLVEELKGLRDRLDREWQSLSTTAADKILERALAILNELGNPDIIQIPNNGGHINRNEILGKRDVINREMKISVGERPFIPAGDWLAPNLEVAHGEVSHQYWGHIASYDELYNIVLNNGGMLRSGLGQTSVDFYSSGKGHIAKVRRNGHAGIVPLIFTKQSFANQGIRFNTDFGFSTLGFNQSVPLRLLAPFSKTFVWQALLSKIETRGEELTDESKAKIAKALGYLNYSYLENDLSQHLEGLHQRIELWALDNKVNINSNASSALAEYVLPISNPDIKDAVKMMAKKFFASSDQITNIEFQNFRLAVTWSSANDNPDSLVRDLITPLLFNKDSSNGKIAQVIADVYKLNPVVLASKENLFAVLEGFEAYMQHFQEIERYETDNDQFRGSHFRVVRFMASEVLLNDVDLAEFQNLAELLIAASQNAGNVYGIDEGRERSVFNSLEQVRFQNQDDNSQSILDIIDKSLSVNFKGSEERAEFVSILKDVRKFLLLKSLESGRVQRPGSVNASSALASVSAVGGINFDPTLLNLQIKRDEQGVPLPLPQQNIEQINIQGLYPIIINIQPVNAQTLPLLLGQTAQSANNLPVLALKNFR